MKWCRFSAGGEASFGLIQDETVVRVDGTPWGQHTVTGQIMPLADVKLEIPVIHRKDYADVTAQGEL